MYKSHCSCSGEEYTSIIVKPETCATEFHKHHKHDAENNEIECSVGECHDCTSHTHDCGCDSPKSFFIKIKDKALNDDAKFLITNSVILEIYSIDLFVEICSKTDDLELDIAYADPPPKIKSSLDYLISLQQLKIPLLA